MNSDKMVLKTKMRLKLALVQLLEDKQINKITVSKLCTAAGVNRNTFYTHYAEPMDLLLDIQNEFFEGIQRALTAVIDSEDILKGLTDIFKKVLKYRKIILILDENNPSDFFDVIVNKVMYKADASWRALGFKGTEDDMQIIFYTATSGCVRATIYWLRHAPEKPPEAMANYIYTCIMFGITKYLPGIKSTTSCHRSKELSEKTEKASGTV